MRKMGKGKKPRKKIVLSKKKRMGKLGQGGHLHDLADFLTVSDE